MSWRERLLLPLTGFADKQGAAGGVGRVFGIIVCCGKSYLLFNLFKDHLLAEGADEQHIIEMAFDSFENKRFRDPE